MAELLLIISRFLHYFSFFHIFPEEKNVKLSLLRVSHVKFNSVPH